MYASIDFATKTAFRAAVRRGDPVVLYSPILGTPAVNGRETVVGPWKPDCQVRGWKARVTVQDMRVVRVH